MYMFILQQVCYYVLHRHIQQAKREREKESECLLYFRIPALEVYKLFFFDTNLGLIVDGFFYYSSLFNNRKNSIIMAKCFDTL